MTEQGLLAPGEWQYVIERGRVMSVKEHHLMPVKWWLMIEGGCLMFVRERHLMSAKKFCMIDRGHLMVAGWWYRVEGERYSSLCCLD